MLRGLPLFAAILLGAVNAGPCDLYDAAKTPCVAAHSTVRALYDNFSDALYQVKRGSDQKTLDIKPRTAGGIADAASHDAFCKGADCVISIIYDQSDKKNHLTSAPGGGAKKTPDDPAKADRLPIMINGQKAYGVWIDSGMGYRNNNTTGVATGDDAEAMYMIADGTHYNGGCCFDYGNAETTNMDDGPATMEAIYIGNIRVWGSGEGTGPWIMADLEEGLFGCENAKYCPNTPTVKHPFLVAMLKGRSGGTFAIKQGNAESGKLQTTYDGARPKGYTVMKKQGAIILGIGGDNSNGAVGSFYEGVMVSGDPANDVDDKVQENIVAAGYGSKTVSANTATYRNSTSSAGPTSPAAASAPVNVDEPTTAINPSVPTPDVPSASATDTSTDDMPTPNAPSAGATGTSTDDMPTPNAQSAGATGTHQKCKGRV